MAQPLKERVSSGKSDNRYKNASLYDPVKTVDVYFVSFDGEASKRLCENERALLYELRQVPK